MSSFRSQDIILDIGHRRIVVQDLSVFINNVLLFEEKAHTDIAWDPSIIHQHPTCLKFLFLMYADSQDETIRLKLLECFPDLKKGFAHVLIKSRDQEKIVELYFKNGLLHSLSAETPAVYYASKHAMWFKNGVIHNSRGPAKIGLGSDAEMPRFALNGERFDSAAKWWIKKQAMRKKDKDRFIEVVKRSVLKSSPVCKDLHPIIVEFL
jgi:hypothetical protein